MTFSYGRENETLTENTQDLRNVIDNLDSGLFHQLGFLLTQTDVPPVLIGHGMGALIILDYLRQQGAPPFDPGLIKRGAPELPGFHDVPVNKPAASVILINPYPIPLISVPVSLNPYPSIHLIQIPPPRQKLLVRHTTFFWPLLFGGRIRMINQYMAAVSYYQKMTKEEVADTWPMMNTEYKQNFLFHLNKLTFS